MSNLVETLLTHCSPEAEKMLLAASGNDHILSVKRLENNVVYIASLRTPPENILNQYPVNGTFFDNGPVCGHIAAGICTLIASGDQDSFNQLKVVHGY